MKNYKIELEPGAHPEPHEYKTAEVLVTQGPVLFLCPVRNRGAKTPDLAWKGLKWEVKAPKSHKNLVHNVLKAALRQSSNIIVDLRRIDCPIVSAVKTVANYALENKSVARMLIIDKRSRIICVK